MRKDEALKKLQAVKSYMTSGNPIWDVKEIAEAFDMAIEALSASEPERKTMICGACSHSDSEALYVTNPPRIQCMKTGNLHFTTDICDCENMRVQDRNEEGECDELRYKNRGES